MNKITFFALIFSFTLFCSATNAATTNVFAGDDYFHTVAGSSFDFSSFSGGAVGLVDFKGVPIDPIQFGNSDTIVRRLEDAELPAVGSSDTIDIEMIALSLQSVSVVDIGGSFFDVFVTLDPQQQQSGSMTITHEFDDNLTDLLEGTFTSTHNLFLDVIFNEVAGTGANDFIVELDNLVLSTCAPTSWTHERTNKPEFPNETNFYVASSVCEEHPGVGVHRARVAGEIPEPSSLLLLAGGLIPLFRHRKNKA